MNKLVLLETWLSFSVFLWLINAISLVMLPHDLWDCFNLVGFFIGTSLNLGVVANVFLNIKYKLNKL